MSEYSIMISFLPFFALPAAGILSFWSFGRRLVFPIFLSALGILLLGLLVLGETFADHALQLFDSGVESEVATQERLQSVFWMLLKRGALFCEGLVCLACSIILVIFGITRVERNHLRRQMKTAR